VEGVRGPPNPIYLYSRPKVIRGSLRLGADEDGRRGIEAPGPGAYRFRTPPARARKAKVENQLVVERMRRYKTWGKFQRSMRGPLAPATSPTVLASLTQIRRERDVGQNLRPSEISSKQHLHPPSERYWGHSRTMGDPMWPDFWH
jgi:hypothetical protein